MDRPPKVARPTWFHVLKILVPVVVALIGLAAGLVVTFGPHVILSDTHTQPGEAFDLQVVYAADDHARNAFDEIHRRM